MSLGDSSRNRNYLSIPQIYNVTVFGTMIRNDLLHQQSISVWGSGILFEMAEFQ